MHILAIQNCQIEGFGRYEQYFINHGIDYEVVHAYQNQSLPPIETVDAIIIGGTPISAYAAHGFPFLQQQCEYLQRALSMHKPCFGICCGAQLLAQVLGAKVQRCQQKEIGGYDVRLTRAGQHDPLLEGFPDHFPVFHWHGDTFDLPAGAELLVEGDSCRNQMFRYGNVVGVQFHLEVTSREASVWADEYASELSEFGKSKVQVLTECHEREQEMGLLAARFMHNFLVLIL